MEWRELEKRLLKWIEMMRKDKKLIDKVRQRIEPKKEKKLEEQ